MFPNILNLSTRVVGIESVKEHKYTATTM